MQITEFHTVFPDLLHIFSDRDLLHFTDLEYCDSVENQWLRQWVESSERISWRAYEQADFVGFVSAYLVEKHKTASITIVVLEQFQHKGYGESMLKYALTCLFAMGYVRIEAQICTENNASVQLFESLDFTCEGRLRKNFLIDGILRDSFLYAKIAESNENKS